jgi:hypothetical protein
MLYVIFIHFSKIICIDMVIIVKRQKIEVKFVILLGF